MTHHVQNQGFRIGIHAPLAMVRNFNVPVMPIIPETPRLLDNIPFAPGVFIHNERRIPEIAPQPVPLLFALQLGAYNEMFQQPELAALNRPRNNG